MASGDGLDLVVGLAQGGDDLLLHLAAFGVCREVDHVDIVADIVGRKLVECQAAEVCQLIGGQCSSQPLFFYLLEHQMLIEVVNIGIGIMGKPRGGAASSTA